MYPKTRQTEMFRDHLDHRDYFIRSTADQAVMVLAIRDHLRDHGTEAEIVEDRGSRASVDVEPDADVTVLGLPASLRWGGGSAVIATEVFRVAQPHVAGFHARVLEVEETFRRAGLIRDPDGAFLADVPVPRLLTKVREHLRASTTPPIAGPPPA